MVSVDEFIYLVQGNWFELKNINQKKVQPYDIYMLQNEIMSQVLNRSENLSLINISFGTVYKNSHIEDISVHLDDEKFQHISQVLETETRHPIITFHGTSNINIVNSILETGYLVPGSENKIKVAHGTMYGPGIYSSPHFDKALTYTKPDDSAHVYILINMVFLGRVRLIPAGVGNDLDKSVETKIVHGLEQLVSTNPAKIIPVGLIKIKVEKN